MDPYSERGFPHPAVASPGPKPFKHANRPQSGLMMSYLFLIVSQKDVVFFVFLWPPSDNSLPE